MAREVLMDTGALRVENMPNQKKRQRAIYWRPVVDSQGNPVKDDAGNPLWTQTRLLPSDFGGRELYLGKGFRLTPPSAEAIPGRPESELEIENRILKDKLALQEKQYQDRMAGLEEAFGKRLANLEANLKAKPRGRRKKSSGEGQLS